MSKTPQTENSVNPVIRVGILIDFTPKPTKSQAKYLIGQLIKNWKDAQEKYKEIIATEAKISSEDLRFYGEEGSWTRWEENTYVLDLPRIQFTDYKYQNSFNTRLCVAICTGKMSTKVWSRVGMPLDESHVKARLAIPIARLNHVAALYRKIAQATANWMSNQLIEIARIKHPKMKIKQRREIEISAFGLRDKGLETSFEQFTETEINAIDILKEKEANNRLSFYYQNASNKKDDLYNLSMEDPNSSWFTSSVKVLTTRGYFQTREVLYLMRPINEKTELIGLGYDDSAMGDLAHRSVIKVSRWLGMVV